MLVPYRMSPRAGSSLSTRKSVGSWTTDHRRWGGEPLDLAGVPISMGCQQCGRVCVCVNVCVCVCVCVCDVCVCVCVCV